jgi:hypothetical protein
VDIRQSAYPSWLLACRVLGLALTNASAEDTVKIDSGVIFGCDFRGRSA